MSNHEWMHGALHVLKHAMESKEGKEVQKAIVNQACVLGQTMGVPGIVVLAVPVAAVSALGYGLWSYFNKK